MKINCAKYFIIIAWILLSFLNSCKKEAAKANSFVPTIITTDSITNITATSAISGGEITSEGRTPVTARGVCWSTSRNPTTANSKTTDGTGTGSFTSAITGLTIGTTYYVRAYAANSIGTSYGKEISFEINDYLPLTVGAKYKYKYSDSYSYIHERSKEEGECIWKFISKSVDTTVVYKVEQSFTGDYFYNNDYGQNYSWHYENQISALSFEVLNDGKVAFTFPVPYWGYGVVPLERFLQTDKIDTCFLFFGGTMNHGCLRSNVGITNLFYRGCGNHCSTVSYSLIEGPYY